MTTGWTLFYTFSISVGCSLEEYRIVSIENDLPLGDLKFAGLLKEFFDLTLMLYGLDSLAMQIQSLASLERQ